MKIFYDVDTQEDFMNQNGALYVPNAELIKPNLKKLTDYAENNNIKILGSVDRHFGTKKYKDKEGELARWGGPFPDHCMDKTDGVLKIPETFTGKMILIPSTKLDYIELEFPQIIFEKQSYDAFYSLDNTGGNQNIESALKQLDVTEAIIYGVATDYCVKAAALGIRQRGIDTFVVSDAIAAVNINPDDGKKALEELCNAGVKLITTKEVIGK